MAANFEFNDDLVSDLYKNKLRWLLENLEEKFCSRNLMPNDYLNMKTGPKKCFG